VNDIIPVLLYHSVDDEPARDPRFAVSPATFKAHIDAIQDSGRVTVRISDLATAMREKRPSSERVVAVTFDDGFADTYDAVHLLLDRGLRSTVYVITGEVGAPGRLTSSQVAELASISQIEIGAHSVHHPYLDELGHRALADETELSKGQLEDMTQGPIDSFAYPHGAYGKRVRQAVIDAGYSSAVAVKNAISHAADDRFAIARWTVTAGTSASRIAEILEGENVPRAWARERVRTCAYRTVRRGRRRLATVLEGHS
jgi:peptidoglycan/xylan/chitin deacetylase (PgdA/CDA1 family)